VVANTKNVSCDFPDAEHACGYIVGECWDSAAVSYSHSSGKAQLLKCNAH